MRIAIILMFIIAGFSTKAQVKVPPALDSVAARVIHYLQQQQPDSIYRMTGKAFQEKITAENFNSISTTKIFPLNDFKNVTFEKFESGISKYQVEGEPRLQLLIGLDDEKKIQTLLVQQYMP